MMATYYSSGGSEIQPAGGAVVAPGPPDSSNNLQTLYLMNPTFSSGGGGGGGGGRGTSYNHHPSSSSSSHDQQQQHHNQLPTNMFLLNSHDPSVVTSSSSSSPFSHTFHQQQQQHHHHHLVGIPLATQSPHHHQDDHRPSPSSSSGGNIHEIPPTSLHGFLPRVHYNLWNSAATTVTTQLDPSSSSSPHHHIPTAIAMTTSGDGFRRPPPLTIQQHYQQQQQQQGLSLSLNNNNNNNSPNTNNKITTIVQDPVVGHHQTVSGMGLLPHHMGTIIPGDNSSTGPPTSTSGMTNVVGGVGSLVLGSKYLKVTQELLDEVVNVETGVVVNDKVVVDSNNQKDKLVAMGIEGGETSVGGGGGVSQQQQQQELSTTQRQELQMKKAKLLNMLDEVEQRYRQYHTQMQIVVTSFEQTAGIGSARSYTALALQTISKQFRCLKDAITSQIKATSKTLGEDDGSYNSKGAAAGDGTHTTTTTTRLRFVDHQLRQQRALQQLGMVQHNAWRPQRGLPERAVSVLRAWLFEHFLHPYPKDSDKHMLAKQTGLTRSQVSNWFINARVRLWKPMVEEMYLEEVKAQEQNSTTTNHHRVNDQNNNPVTVATGANNINNNEHLDNNDHDSSSAINNRSSSSNPIHTHHTHPQQPQVEKSTHILNHTNTLHDHHHNISNPPTMLSSPTQLGHHHHHLHHQSGGTSAALQNFSLIGTSSAQDMESILFRRSPKRQRSIDIHHNNNNSPTSIISMEMEMKSGGNQDHQPTQNHLFMTPAGGFGPFSTMSEIGSRSSFDPSDQQQLAAHQFMHGNGGVSLTLGLPHGENQLSPHHHHQQQLQHHNFIPTQNMQLAGRRVIDHHQIEQVGDHHHHHHHRAAAAAAAAEFCGITNSTQQPPSGTAGAYDGIDLQNRKRFAAAQLLPDFVIQQ